MEQAQKTAQQHDAGVNFDSAFMKRKVDIEKIVSSLDGGTFFNDISRNISLVTETVESGRGLVPEVLESLHESYLKMCSIDESYDDVLSCSFGASSPRNRFNNVKSLILDACKNARVYAQKSIQDYFISKPVDKVSGSDVGGSDGLVSIDREDERARYFSDISRVLRLDSELSELSKIRECLVSKRKDFLQSSDTPAPIIDQSWDFINGYSLHLVEDSSGCFLEIVHDGKSILRWNSRDKICNDRKVRKEMVSDLLKLDSSIDEDVLERKILERMADVRETLDSVVESPAVKNKKNKKFKSLNSSDADESLGMLKSPEYLFSVKSILDFKVAGEDCLKLSNYIVATSARFAAPHHLPQGLFVRSLSGSGKTYVSKAALSLIPEDNIFMVVDTTDKVLKYMRDDLWGKIFFVEEWTKLNDGVAKILRQLMSGSGDSETLNVERDDGKYITRRVKLNGTPAFISGTVLNAIDDQLLNRCWLVHTDVSPEQTRKILDFQSHAGISRKRNDDVFRARCETLRNSYDLFEKMGVVNPFSGITQIFLSGSDVVDRRQSQKLQGFLETVSLLHQYQRHKVEIGGECYVVSGLSDVYSSLRILEPFLRMSFSRVSHEAQVVYQVLKSFENSDNYSAGVSVEDIRKSPLIDEKGLQHGVMDRDSVKGCLGELSRGGFVESRDGFYSLKDQKFSLDGVTMNRSLLERNVSQIFEDCGSDMEMCGFVYDGGSKSFRWDLYKESVVDPLSGKYLNIGIRDADSGNLKVVVYDGS